VDNLHPSDDRKVMVEPFVPHLLLRMDCVIVSKVGSGGSFGIVTGFSFLFLPFLSSASFFSVDKMMYVSFKNFYITRK